MKTTLKATLAQNASFTGGFILKTDLNQPEFLH